MFKNIPADKNVLYNIHYGNFNNFGGSTDIDKTLFDKLKNKMNKHYAQKASPTTHLFYKYRNLEMTLIKNYKQFSLIKPIYSKMEKNFCITIFKRIPQTFESFPLINKYHTHCTKKINKFTINKDVRVLFVEETHTRDGDNNNIFRNIIIEFFYKGDQKIYDQVNKIIKDIF